MKDGTVVMVLGHIDNKVREKDKDRVGTVVQIAGDMVWVLLQDSIMWIGHRRDVAEAKEQS